MLKDPMKVALIADLNHAQGDVGVKKVMSLLEILISETREDNDTADGSQFYRNQGKIQGFKEFMEIIRRGAPGT